MDKTIAIFPARAGSKKIPDKNIVDFLGRPIISYALEAAQASNLFDTIHVSTDSEEIASISGSLGADVRFRRPSILAEDSVPIFHVVRYVLKEFGKAGEKFNKVCIIFPCSPFLSTSDLREANELFKGYAGRSRLMVASEAPSRIEKYFRVNGDLLVPIDKAFEGVRTQDLDPAFYNVGMFTFHHADEFLLGEEGHSDIVYKMPFWKTISIDSMENLRFAELLYRAVHG